MRQQSLNAVLSLKLNAVLCLKQALEFHVEFLYGTSRIHIHRQPKNSSQNIRMQRVQCDGWERVGGAESMDLPRRKEVVEIVAEVMDRSRRKEVVVLEIPEVLPFFC